MQRFQRGGVVATVLAIVALLALPIAAHASLEDPATYLSSTNPNIGDGATWRWSWGNSHYPSISVEGIPSDGGVDTRNQTLGFIYEVRQVNQSGSGTVTPNWDTSSHSPQPTGTLITNVFNIEHLNDVFGWTAYPGATVRGEGMYAVTRRFYNQLRIEEPDNRSAQYFGLDFTAPNPVASLTATAAGVPMAAGKWTEARWRDVAWDRVKYDALSGVGGYKVSVNASDAVFVHNTSPDPLYEPYGLLLNGFGPAMPPIKHITMEDLPAGDSTIKVTVVDRATNVSQVRSVHAYVDYDTPTLSVTNPASGAKIGIKPTLSVTASDSAGIAKVSYYVDGVAIGTSTTSPFGLTPDLSGFSAGAHVLKVVAEDRIGAAPGAWHVPHTVTKTVSFTLDKTPVRVTNFSRTPAIFYPIIREGYYDNSTIKYTLNKTATVTLKIRDSGGKVRRTITATRNAGNNKFTWDGKWASDGKVHVGSSGSATYYYQITAVDSAGYTATTSKISTTIRNYELVKTGTNTVKVVKR